MQLDADLARLRRSPELLRRKWTRMAASPFSFLRGASALWAEALKREPSLLRGVPGHGTLVGDLHLENVGTFRTARGVALHVNDFDETFHGPWSFDVARLLTSTLLARSELGCTGLEVLALAEEVLEGHALGVRGSANRLPSSLQAAVNEAAKKADARFLSKRLAGPEKLVRDDKTPAAPANRRPWARAAVDAWAQATGHVGVELLDLTRRVAGTGSLGVERLVALVRVGEHLQLLELKEVRGSAFSTLQADAARLLRDWRTCLPRPPLDVAAAMLGAIPVIVRPLFASDDKLAVEDFDPAQWRPTVRAIGVMAGEVHRRGASTSARWSAANQRQVLDASAHLAGLHEQAFVHFCRGVAEHLVEH